MEYHQFDSPINQEEYMGEVRTAKETESAHGLEESSKRERVHDLGDRQEKESAYGSEDVGKRERVHMDQERLMRKNGCTGIRGDK